MPLMNKTHFFKLIGIGCASVLKTNLSNGIWELSPKSKYKYLSVSPRKKVSILSRLGGGILVTSSKEQYPPVSTFVYFSKASKICQPHSRYLEDNVYVYDYLEKKISKKKN